MTMTAVLIIFWLIMGASLAAFFFCSIKFWSPVPALVAIAIFFGCGGLIFTHAPLSSVTDILEGKTFAWKRLPSGIGINGSNLAEAYSHLYMKHIQEKLMPHCAQNVLAFLDTPNLGTAVSVGECAKTIPQPLAQNLKDTALKRYQ